MFKTKAEDTLDSQLEKAIYDAARELDGFTAEGPEYKRIVDQMEKLQKLRTPKSEPLSHNTLAVVLGNLMGIAVIVKYEQLNVMTSKALSFVMKAST